MLQVTDYGVAEAAGQARLGHARRYLLLLLRTTASPLNGAQARTSRCLPDKTSVPATPLSAGPGSRYPWVHLP